MFCRNCGTQLRDGARFCESCGTRNETEAISNKRQEVNIFKQTQIAVWAICAVLAVMFFLPMFSISLFGFKFEFSACEIMIGKEIEGYVVKGNVLVASLILLPPLIALFYDRENIHLSVIGSSLGIIALVIFSNYVRTRVSEETESLINSVQFTSVFAFSMILYIISGTLSCWYAYCVKNKKIAESDNIAKPENTVRPESAVMPLDKDSNGMKFSQKELTEFAELADFANAIYNGIYNMEETQNFKKDVDIRAEELSSSARASVLFWYQYFNNSSDERIRTEGDKFCYYHRVAINDLEDMMAGLFGNCTDADIQSFRIHYITQEEADGTSLMGCSDDSDNDEIIRRLKIDNCTRENGMIKLAGTVKQEQEDRTGSAYQNRNFSAWFLPDERSPIAGYRFDRLVVD